MEINFHIEWTYGLSLGLFDVLSFTDKIEADFVKRHYGESIKRVGIMLICRPTELNQRKRFTKSTETLLFDIIFNFNVMKDKDSQALKGIIRERIIKVTKYIFSKYNFQDFDKGALLRDLETDVNSIPW